MLRTKIGLLVAMAMLATGAVAVAAPPSASLPAAFDLDLLDPKGSGRAIVGFTHTVDDRTIRKLSKAGITHAVVLDTINAVGVLGPMSAYRAISAWSDVQYVDADSRIRFDNFGAKKDTKTTQVRAGARPLRRGYTGKGITVAIIDTGIDSTHPDLTSRVVRHVNFEPSWFMDMIHDGKYSDQLSEATGNPIDSYGHGTHVAGIVAGTGQAGQGADFSGVAPEATLVNFKIADAWQGITCDVPCDLGWEMNALVAYEYAIEHRNDSTYPGGIRVINNSWSTTEVDSEVEPISLIVQASYRKGQVSVFSAGNSGPDADTVGLGPNRLEEVITVAAACKTNGYAQTNTCAKGEIANFSSRGPQVDVTAPGVGIFSPIARASIFGPLSGHSPPPGASNQAATLQNATLYGALSGTSMSAPHVAGIVALMLQANPRLTPAQVERILITTATDKGPRGFDNTWGFGMVDAHRAVAAAIAPPARARVLPFRPAPLRSAGK